MNIIDVISRFLLLATMCPQRYPLTWLMGLAMILTLALLILLVMILFKLFWEL